MAVIEALGALRRPCRVVLYLDSEYVRKGITEWISGWKARGWRTAARQEVKNVDLWQRLDALVSTAAVTRSNGAGSRATRGDAGNDRADMLANRGVELARAPVEVVAATVGQIKSWWELYPPENVPQGVAGGCRTFAG